MNYKVRHTPRYADPGKYSLCPSSFSPERNSASMITSCSPLQLHNLTLPSAFDSFLSSSSMHNILRYLLRMNYNYGIMLKFSYCTFQLPFFGNPGDTPFDPSHPAAIMATAVSKPPFEGKYGKGPPVAKPCSSN